MIQHYLKVSFREFLKHKTSNIISVLGLSVSLMCFSLCLYCSRNLQSVDTCFAKHKQIVEFHMYSNNHVPFAGTPATLIHNPQITALGEIESLCRVTYMRERPYNVNVKDGEDLPYTFTTIETDSSYQKLFTPTVIAGNWEEASHTVNAIILSESAARKVFKQANRAIGKHMTLLRRLSSSPETTPKTGGILYTVKAVVKDFPINAGMNLFRQLDMLTLNDSEGFFQANNLKTTGCITYAFVREGTSVDKLEEHLKKMKPTQLYEDQQMLIKASRIGQEHQKRMAINYISWGIAIVGLLVLIAGMLNFFHFLIGSFLNRTREYSIRKVTGGESIHLFGLLFTQAVILVILASLFSFCFVELMCPKLQIELSEFTLHFEPSVISLHISQYLVLIILICVLISGCTTIRLRKISIQAGIQGGEKSINRHRLRNIMLGIQFFICWLFISLTVAFYLQSEKTLHTLFDSLSKDEKASIFSIPLDYYFMKNDEKLNLANRLRQHAGIKDIMLSDVNYINGISGNTLQTEKGNDNSWIQIDIMSVPENFFSFMNIPLLSGRTIQNNKDMVVDKAFADQQKKEVMGTTLYSDDEEYTICGISQQFNTTVYNRTPGFAFLPTDFTLYVGHCYVKALPGHEKEVKEWLQKIQRETLPTSVEATTPTLLDDIYKGQAMERQAKTIILFFSFVCLAITILGTYSAITLDTERRQKEVAIRKINGAGVSQISLLFARLYIYLLVIPAVLAFPIVYLILTFWQQAYTVFFNYGFFYWTGIFVFVAAITTGTILFHILKTARINPAITIKNE